MATNSGDMFLRKPAVRERAGGASDTSIWRWVRDGRFPPPRKIGPRAVGWLKSEIDDWVAGRWKPAVKKAKG
jgi:prophage regulatory protein